MVAIVSAVIILVLIVLFFFILIYIYDYPFMWTLKSKDIGELDREYKNKPRVDTELRTIITLTSTPSRIESSLSTFKSLLGQSKRVDEIRINVPMRSRKGQEYVIPKWMENLRSVRIMRVEKDEGPGTKLYQTYRDEIDDETLFIVCDDDKIYQSRMVERLVNSFEKRGRKDPITNCGRIFEKESTRPSCSNNMFFYHVKNSLISKYVDNVMGFSGFIVQRKMLPKYLVESLDKGPEEVLYVDDDWIGGWLRWNGYRPWCPGFGVKSACYHNPDNEQIEGLCKTENLNDRNTKITNEWFEKKLIPKNLGGPWLE